MDSVTVDLPRLPDHDDLGAVGDRRPVDRAHQVVVVDLDAACRSAPRSRSARWSSPCAACACRPSATTSLGVLIFERRPSRPMERRRLVDRSAPASMRVPIWSRASLDVRRGGPVGLLVAVHHEGRAHGRTTRRSGCRRDGLLRRRRCDGVMGAELDALVGEDGGDGVAGGPDDLLLAVDGDGHGLLARGRVSERSEDGHSDDGRGGRQVIFFGMADWGSPRCSDGRTFRLAGTSLVRRGSADRHALRTRILPCVQCRYVGMPASGQQVLDHASDRGGRPNLSGDR